MALESDPNYKVTPAPCPGCEMPLTGSSDFSSAATPKPGDLSVCINCSTVLVYVTGLTMRKATGSDLRDLSDEERVSLAQHVRATKRLRKRRQS